MFHVAGSCSAGLPALQHLYRSLLCCTAGSVLEPVPQSDRHFSPGVHPGHDLDTTAAGTTVHYPNYPARVTGNSLPQRLPSCQQLLNCVLKTTTSSCRVGCASPWLTQQKRADRQAHAFPVLQTVSRCQAMGLINLLSCCSAREAQTWISWFADFMGSQTVVTSILIYMDFQRAKR